MNNYNINPEPCDFNPGDILDGKFRIQERLGEGTFGIVYAGQDVNNDTYAIKLLKLWDVPDQVRDSIVNRFQMEFEAARLDSPYLVHAICHGTVYGNPYIVMEYCPYGDLLSTNRQVDLSVMAIHVLRGLQALHACGKVHRDLKPENVLLKADGTFALTDFGIAGDRNHRMTTGNQVFGTYAYMPPEQLQQKGEATVLPTTDIFSFGVMMYQLLTNSFPFGNFRDNSDLPDYLLNSQAGKWNRAALEAIPGGSQWVPLIDGCLNPNFKQRIQTAEKAIELVPASVASRAMADDVEMAPTFQTQVDNGILLRVMYGENAGQAFHLNDMIQRQPCGVITIGRADPVTRNDIMLTERLTTFISRRHCTLELDDCAGPGQWVIRDGQFDPNTRQWRRSTNGTYVNSQEAEEGGIPFAPGDIISVGDVKLRAEAY